MTTSCMLHGDSHQALPCRRNEVMTRFWRVSLCMVAGHYLMVQQQVIALSPPNLEDSSWGTERCKGVLSRPTLQHGRCIAFPAACVAPPWSHVKEALSTPCLPASPCMVKAHAWQQDPPCCCTYVLPGPVESPRYISAWPFISCPLAGEEFFPQPGYISFNTC